jgi:mannose-6-phosphate isomerase
MEMPQSEVNERLEPLLTRIIPRYEDDKLKRGSEDFWAARAAKTYNRDGDTDRGIFSIYFFNLVNARAGDAVFQDAGLPHAYLEGQNVEIMANSDNVLRGGLTPKHVDVPELMKHIRFVPTDPQIVRGLKSAEGMEVFITPARDFELSTAVLAKGEQLSFSSRSIQIYLVLEGEVLVTESGEHPLPRKKGEAWIAFDKAVFGIKAGSRAVIYRAAIPAL